MRIPGQFNVPPSFRVDGAPDWFRAFLERHTLVMKRLAQSLTGPTLVALGNVGATATAKLYLGDLLTATLTANTVITLDAETRGSAEGLLQLTQDVTGGRAPTWVNALWTGGAAPAIALGAGKRTLIGFTFNGSGWIGRILASNY